MTRPPASSAANSAAGSDTAGSDTGGSAAGAAGARRVLITGANGFVGRNLCACLSQQNWIVRAAVRTVAAGRALAAAETVVTGDLGETTDWQDALRDVDAVVHCAARVHVLAEKDTDPLGAFRRVNVAGTEQLARQAAVTNVGHFVYLSSIGARIAESGQSATPYQRSKLEAEAVLRKISAESGMSVTLLRPPLIYGAQAPGNFSLLMKIIRQGIPLPVESIENRRAFLYIGNLCDAVRICLEKPGKAVRQYELADGDGVSTPELIRELAGVLKRPARLWPCPLWLLRLVGRITGRSAMVERLTGSLDLDISPLKKDLDWSPPWSFRAGLKASIATAGGEPRTPQTLENGER